MKHLPPFRTPALGCAALLIGLATAALPAPAFGCACGCGVFEVGTPAMFPSHAGGMLSLEYDFMDQNANWSGAASAPAADNADRRIRTSFVTLAARWQLDRRWGAQVELPYWHRLFRTADGGGDASFAHDAVGDVRVLGTFTGLAPDLSTGVRAGLKLPTGDDRYAHFDRDTEIGTGATDLLLGAYHVGALTAARTSSWFVEAQFDLPFATAGDYRPGAEGDVTATVTYANARLGRAKLAPMLGVIGSLRARDAGGAANPEDSGYERVLLAPGLDARFAGLRATLSLNVPVHERVNGHQLVAPALVKLVLARGI